MCTGLNPLICIYLKYGKKRAKIVIAMEVSSHTSVLTVLLNADMVFCRLFAGYNKSIRVFDVHRPGRDFEEYSLAKGGEGPTGK
jgi:hypothetical protein